MTDEAPQHATDPSITYEDVVSRIRGASENSIEARFDIGKLAELALRMGFGLEELSDDTGFKVTTLRMYMKAWQYWGEDRIPGPRAVWTVYTMHLGHRKQMKWLDEHGYRAAVLQGGRAEAERLMQEYWIEERGARAPQTPDQYRAWRVGSALTLLWNAVVQLDLVDYKTLTEEERARMAKRFGQVLEEAEKFKRQTEEVINNGRNRLPM